MMEMRIKAASLIQQSRRRLCLNLKSGHTNGRFATLRKSPCVSVSGRSNRGATNAPRRKTRTTTVEWAGSVMTDARKVRTRTPVRETVAGAVHRQLTRR